MKNIIKDRFEQIQNGKIPQGYKKTKIGIVPNDWEVKFFKDVFKIINNNTLSRNDMNNVNGRIKNIHYGDILIRYSEILDCNNVDIPYINEGIELKNSVFLKDGDIVFADTAEDYTVGKMIEIINVNCSKIVSGLHTIPCTPKIDFGKRWLGYYCNSDKFHHQMLPLITGTKVSSISKSSIQNIEIVYPGVIEQQKIAGILSIQDRVIELKKRLIKEKKKQKKYLMQNLLTGKIRLKGFKGEWKKVKLGEICDIVKGEQINKSTLSKAGKYYVLNGGITSSGYTDVWNTYENTISISEGGNSCGFVNFNREKFWSGGHCYTLQKINVDLIKKEFLYCYLKHYENDLMNLRVGSGLPNIQKSSLYSFYVIFPSLEEQETIAKILSTQDKEIELLQKQLEQEKQKKKALMQLLLTGIVRV